MVGVVWTRRTGWTPGGLVTPGLLALAAPEPAIFFGVVAIGSALGAVLRPISSRLGLYGRERVAAAMLVALALRGAMSLADAAPISDIWIGWVAPALIACDSSRQGAPMTAVSCVACALASAFALRVAASLLEALS